MTPGPGRPCHWVDLGVTVGGGPPAILGPNRPLASARARKKPPGDRHRPSPESALAQEAH